MTDRILPDPIERMEARIDELVDAQFSGVPDGFIRCYGCRCIIPIDEVNTASANPDSPAYCFECLICFAAASIRSVMDCSAYDLEVPWHPQTIKLFEGRVVEILRKHFGEPGDDELIQYRKYFPLLYDWAKIWHRQAGGYMASDTSMMMLRCEALATGKSFKELCARALDDKGFNE